MSIPYQAEIEGIPGGEFIVKSLERLRDEFHASPFKIASRHIRVGQGNPEGVVDGAYGDIYIDSVPRVFNPNDSTTHPHALYLKQLEHVNGRGTSGWFLVTTVGPNGMTPNRIPYSDGGSVLQSSANLGFDGTTLNALQFATNQITFPATQLPSSNANALDDYEEGTWTPVDGSGAGLTYTLTGTPNYVKVGQLVLVSADVTWPVTANGNQAKIGGLPFTTHANTIQAATVGYCTFATQVTMLINLNATTIDLFNPGGAAITNANMSTQRIIFSGAYRAAA